MRSFKAGVIQIIPELAKTPIRQWQKHWQTAIDTHVKNLKERQKGKRGRQTT